MGEKRKSWIEMDRDREKRRRLWSQLAGGISWFCKGQKLTVLQRVSTSASVSPVVVTLPRSTR